MSDAGDRSVQLGQFRLMRLQVVNWGTFTGYQDFPVDERGVLFTGPSGSGKSSLIDAHSAVLLPTHDQRFNASADLSARGAKQATRSVADYVRGAWSETNDEHEQSRVRYLRGGKATWSAIAATYADGLGSATTAVLVKWFTGAETDGSSLKSMYQLHDGRFDLTALEEWAKRGFDTRWLKLTQPASYPDTQIAYVRELGKRIGLGSSKTALSLLGKAKAMKNVGDLNYFIRGNVLDEPETFTAAQKMLDAFTPLNEAYETARRAHAQEKVLRDVPDNWAKYRESGREGSLAESLLGAPAERYLRGVHLRVIEAALNEIDEAIGALDAELGEQEVQREQARSAYVSLDEQLRREGQALEELKLRLESAKTEATARERAYRGYRGLVERLGRGCPEGEDAFAALREELPAILEQARGEKAEIEPRRHSVFAAAGQARRLHQAKSAELTALRSAKSLIPPAQIQRRECIANGAGIEVTDLPYAAELIDVADGEERWRPAVEKVLRNYGLRLLVPAARQDAVKRFIDENDMRGVVEYSVVEYSVVEYGAASAQHPHPKAGTLATKLTVDTGHPSGAWLAGRLAKKFDHMCVETAAELDDHPIAVTPRGTVKLPGNHYRKDDRPELTHASAYILGANTAAKLAALEAEVDELAEACDRAVAEADELDARYRRLDGVIDAGEQIAGYTAWSQLDHFSAAATARGFEHRIAQIKADDVDLRELEEQRDDAEERWKNLSDACSGLRTKLGGHNSRQADLVAMLEQEEVKPHTIEHDVERAYLDAVFSDVEVPVTPESMPQVRVAFRKELERRRDAANSDRRLTHARLKTAVDRFLEQWESTAPDNSGDVDRSGGDFAALYEDIVGRKLPDAMGRFERMISEDMVPSISVLHRSIENATTEIERRIAMVNAGLRRVEFNPGSHLQIAYKPNPSADVKDFRSRVDALLRDAPAARRKPEKLLTQFKRVRELMARFTGDGAEAQRWRANVLDVRTSYMFYGCEQDGDGVTTTTYRNTASNSGGEQEKLVAFCLAAALSYNLADPDSDGRPRFAPLMLDEAFSKSDEAFSQQALAAFDEFGFQLIIAAPIRMSGILEPFIGQAVLVDKRVRPDGAQSNAATATFGELVARAGD